MTRDMTELMVAFVDTVEKPLYSAFGDRREITVYSIGNDGLAYGSILEHMLIVKRNAEIVPLRVDVRGDVVGGFDDLRKDGQKTAVDGRYQVVVSPAKFSDSPYRVGKRIREREDEHGWQTTGMSVVWGGSYPGHALFQDVTRERLLDPLRREPYEEARPVYGARAASYVDGRFERVLSQVTDESIIVLERPGWESAAQYLCHRLYESGKNPKLLRPEESMNGETKILIPGRLEEKDDYIIPKGVQISRVVPLDQV